MGLGDTIQKNIGLFFSIGTKIPFALLGDHIQSQSQNYESLRKQLKQARISTSYEMYLSNAIFYSVIAGIVGAILGVITAYVILNVITLPDQLTNLTFSQSSAWLLAFRNLFIALFVMVFLTILVGGGVYVLFLVYPSFVAGERKSKINGHLPYAVTFMYALSNGGMNIVEIMRALSTAEQTYGEVSKEVDTIVRDMDLFGSDLRTAIDSTTSITPSPMLQDLLQNLLTVIDSGGNIPVYFKDKSEQYLERAEDDQKGYLETLALIAESYVTAFVAGPLFAIIMGVMMVLMGSGNDMMLYAVIYGLIPIGSVMFVIMINMLSPAGSGKPPILGTTTPLTHDVSIPSDLEGVSDDESISMPDIKQEKRRYIGLIKSKKSLTFKQMVRSPLKPIKETPVMGFAVTMPIALIFVIVSMYTHQTDILIDGFVTTLDDYLIFGMYIAVVPVAIFHEIKSLREKKLQTQIPDFLKKLASTNATGMTLRDSIYMMAKTDTSSLAPELKMIRNDIDWGLSINDALIRFANRIRTSLVSRSITLITKANESSGDIGDVLLVAARDAAKERKMAKERFVNMMIYIVIILMAFMVFLVVIYVISASFLTEMAKAGEQMAASGSDAGFLGAFDIKVYNRMFFHAAVLQGFCSGLIAGVMGEGNVMAGLKYSVVMTTIAYVVFVVFVGA